MGFTVKDGSGKGYEAGVSSENRLFTDAATKPLAQHVNEKSGKAWALAFEDLNPAAADDVVFYLKNTGDNDIVLTDAYLDCSTAASQVEVWYVTGTAASGSALTPYSMTVAGSATPSATIETGTDITGLTLTGLLGIVQCAVVDTQYEFKPRATIIVPKNQAIAITVQTGTANLSGVVYIAERAAV